MFRIGSRALIKRLHNTCKHQLSLKYSNRAIQMEQTGKRLKDILDVLEKFAPLKLAGSWDNVGLLVDPIDENDTKISNILMTNDLTEDVVEEAIDLRAGLIISYHPNIFVGLKRITSATWKERIIVRCLRNNIAVYSPHTSWDAVLGGVNDWLASALPFRSIEPIQPNIDDPNCGAGRLTTLSRSMNMQEAIDAIKKHIGVPYLKLASSAKSKESKLISTVALCAGSGASVLKGTAADLYLTGEMSHHDLLEATQNGISVILCNHSDSERGFLRFFQPMLQSELLGNDVKVQVSKCDKDPLETV